MSLLLDLLRQLLEYLGIPVDQLDQIWENCTNSLGIRRILESPLLPFLIQRIGLEGWKHKEYGNTRSIVRLIGTFLPLDPSPRTHFQSVPSGRVREPKQYTTLCRLDIPSLADIPWVLDNEVLPNATFRHDIFERNPFNLERSCIKTPGLVQTIQNSTKSHLGSNSPTAHASQKIAALENELIQLRAQIAAIVALQDTKSIQSCSETLCSFGSPMNALPPSFASTPIPPPPPPPPPSFPSAKPDPGKSAIDLIKRRKEAHKQHMGEMVAVVKDSMNKHPSMMDVLKGINTIKLRAVERSPGGTPLTRKDKRRSLNDPASIIALALKKKFAHRHTDDSFDKENRSQEDYAFSSPETPQFGRHLLKPVERRTQKRQILISSVANN